MSVSPTELALYTKLKAFVVSFLPALPVLRGLGNRAPYPTGDFLLMQIMDRTQLRTNVATYLDPNIVPDDGTRTVETGMKLLLQFDFYGPNAGDNAQQFVSLWRDDYGCDQLAPEAQPLYTDQGRQIPLVTGEEQWLSRVCVMAALQYNPLVTVAQQFAAAAEVDLINVDVEYPPT